MYSHSTAPGSTAAASHASRAARAAPGRPRVGCSTEISTRPRPGGKRAASVAGGAAAAASSTRGGSTCERSPRPHPRQRAGWRGGQGQQQEGLRPLPPPPARTEPASLDDRCQQTCGIFSEGGGSTCSVSSSSSATSPASSVSTARRRTTPGGHGVVTKPSAARKWVASRYKCSGCSAENGDPAPPKTREMVKPAADGQTGGRPLGNRRGTARPPRPEQPSPAPGLPR